MRQSRSERPARSLMLLLVGLAFLIFLGTPSVHAAASYNIGTDCSKLGWSLSNGTCTMSTALTLNAGDTLVVPSGYTLLAPNDANIYVQAGGIMTVDGGGTYKIGSCGSLFLYGNFTNNGLFNNGCAVTVYGGGTITNGKTGDIENNYQMHIEGGGMVYNFGTFNSYPVNPPDLTNDAGAAIFLECGSTNSLSLSNAYAGAGNLTTVQCQQSTTTSSTSSLQSSHTTILGTSTTGSSSGGDVLDWQTLLIIAILVGAIAVLVSLYLRRTMRGASKDDLVQR